MQKTKLIDLLKSLSKTELRQFEKYLESQSRGKDDRELLLFRYLKKYAPDFQSNRLEKEKVAQKIFPKVKSNVKKLSYVISDLWKSLEDFIVQVMLSEQSFVKKNLLLEYYKKRKLDKFFFSQMEKLKDELQEDKVKSIDYYYQMFQISHLTYSHSSTSKQTTEIESLNNSMNYIDLFYVITKLKYSCEMINREQLLTDSYTIHLLDNILELTDKPPFKDNPIIDLYQRIIHSQKELKYEDLLTLKETFKSNYHRLSRMEQREVIIYITNNFFRLHQSKHKEALNDQFELYLFGLEKEIWLDEGFIYHLHFLNIFNTACMLRELDWAKQFIEDYGHLLHEEYQQNTTLLCLANISFRQENYEASLEFLREVAFSEIHFNIVAKNMTLKCYFELEDYEEALHDFLHAYTMYLKRNKTINDAVKKANINLIKFTRRILKERHVVQEGKEKLQTELAEINDVSARAWLKQKIDLLKN